MGTLSSIGHTIASSIHSVGYVTFGIAVIINIIFYRLHPVLGFLGTLFLFGWLTGLIH